MGSVAVGVAPGRMRLDEVLEQQQSVEAQFEYLVEVHGKVLLGEENKGVGSWNLDEVRRDLSVCLNDFCILNDLLVAHDGELKGQIGLLEESRVVVAKSLERHSKLVSERQSWSSTLQLDPAGPPIDSTSHNILISTRYRTYLDQYIELVGVTDTSLAPKDSLSADERGSTDDRKIANSLQLLTKSHESIQQEIAQLSSLVNELKKDNSFIEREIASKQHRIQFELQRLDEALLQTEKEIKLILSDAGLKLPRHEDHSITQRLFNFKLDEDADRKVKDDKELDDDIIQHAPAFIDVRLNALKTQLASEKDKSLKVVTDRDIWADCVNAVQNLEADLSRSLAQNREISSNDMIIKIGETTHYLESLLNSVYSSQVSILITQEKETLERACLELDATAPVKSDFTTSKPTNIPNNKSELDKSVSRANPSHFIANKSPPKIGIPDSKPVLSVTHNYDLKKKD